MSEPDDRSLPGRPDELPSLSLDDEASEADDLESLAKLLGDRYTPTSRLGAGTFGEVIRARDCVLGRDVAVKRVRLEAFGAPAQLAEVKARFLREAQVAARLRHSNIVTTHDIVSTPRSSFIVMELVEGRDLEALIREKGRLRLGETLDILDQVAAALDHAHASGVVHRDVKPANIMIEPSGRVKVMDFGIAKVEQGGNLTSTGLIMGTPNYMSPEQARGGQVDGRADVFSLGCVLYECLTGRKPFDDESVTAILLRVVTSSAPPIDFEDLGLPHALEGVLGRAMAKEPSRRFASTGELMRAARRAAGGEEIAPAPVSPTGTLVSAPVVGRAASSSAPPEAGWQALPTASRPATRQRLGSWIALLVIIAAGGLTAVALWMRDASHPPAASAEGSLVVEQAPGFLGRLLGRGPRLLITVPAGTRLSLETRTPVNSATTRPGTTVTAEITEAVAIEGREAIGPGARVEGQVARAEPAGDAGGRGHVTLAFHTLALADGGHVPIEAQPVELTARPPRSTSSRKKGLAGAWARITSTVGDIVRDATGERGEGGAVAGARAVPGPGGVDVDLPAGSRLDLELTRSVTVVRAPPR